MLGVREKFEIQEDENESSPDDEPVESLQHDVDGHEVAVTSATEDVVGWMVKLILFSPCDIFQTTVSVFFLFWISSNSKSKISWP